MCRKKPYPRCAGDTRAAIEDARHVWEQARRDRASIDPGDSIGLRRADERVRVAARTLAETRDQFYDTKEGVAELWEQAGDVSDPHAHNLAVRRAQASERRYRARVAAGDALHRQGDPRLAGAILASSDSDGPVIAASPLPGLPVEDGATPLACTTTDGITDYTHISDSRLIYVDSDVADVDQPDASDSDVTAMTEVVYTTVRVYPSGVPDADASSRYTDAIRSDATGWVAQRFPGDQTQAGLTTGSVIERVDVESVTTEPVYVNGVHAGDTVTTCVVYQFNTYRNELADVFCPPSSSPHTDRWADLAGRTHEPDARNALAAYERSRPPATPLAG